jgi:hypothetical protein
LNPRYPRGVHWFSKPAASAAHPPLRKLIRTGFYRVRPSAGKDELSARAIRSSECLLPQVPIPAGRGQGMGESPRADPPPRRWIHQAACVKGLRGTQRDPDRQLADQHLGRCGSSRRLTRHSGGDSRPRGHGEGRGSLRTSESPRAIVRNRAERNCVMCHCRIPSPGGGVSTLLLWGP